jgi:tRNA threonylcarbamoyladenosine biosynthesis protein TsaE
LGNERWKIISHSAGETENLGRLLGGLLRPGDVVALEGDLGAGKTVLTRGIARGLGIRSPITSPTFTLINEYPLNGSFLYRVDCYRLGQQGDATLEALGIGLGDLPDENGIVVLEWAGRVEKLLPPEHLWVELHHLDENVRAIAVEGRGTRGVELLRAWRAASEVET